MVLKHSYGELGMASMERAVAEMARAERGDPPTDPIGAGLDAYLAMKAEQGVTLGDEGRRQAAYAVARVYERDADVTRARIFTLDAARMIVLDAALQREASAIVDLDVIDRRDWLSTQDLVERRPEWLEAEFPSSVMRDMSLDDAATIASGEFQGLSRSTATWVELSMDAVRGPRGVELEARLQAAAGMDDLRGQLARPAEGRWADTLRRVVVEDVPDSRAARERDAALRSAATRSRAVDHRRFRLPQEDGRREIPFETQEIASRAMVSLMHEEVAVRAGGALRGALMELGLETEARAVSGMGARRLPDAGDRHRTAAIEAMADATASQPQSIAGKIVSVASVELRRIGFGEADVAGPRMEAAVARMMSRESPEGEISSMGHHPGVQAARMVVDMAIQVHAAKMLDAIDGRAERGFVSKSDYDGGRTMQTLKEVGLGRMFVASAREREDLKLIAVGAFGEVSNGRGLAYQLDLAYGNVGPEGPDGLAGRLGRAYEGLQRADRVMRGLGVVEPQGDAMAKLRSLSKGPVDVDAELGWDRRRTPEAGR